MPVRRGEPRRGLRGVALPAPPLNFHQVVFKKDSERAAGEVGGWFRRGGGGGLLCVILLCNRLITPDHAVTI